MNVRVKTVSSGFSVFGLQSIIIHHMVHSLHSHISRQTVTYTNAFFFLTYNIYIVFKLPDLSYFHIVTRMCITLGPSGPGAPGMPLGPCKPVEPISPLSPGIPRSPCV